MRRTGARRCAPRLTGVGRVVQRNHIKDRFNGLRDTIPSIRGERTSRATILSKAADYIPSLQKTVRERRAELESLRAANQSLRMQIASAESGAR